MRCRIVKMHYPSRRVHISLAGQNLSERLEHVLTEAVTVQLLPRGEPFDKSGAPEAQITVSIVFGAALVGLALVGTSSADTHHILS
jgi:hypothetical protein